MGSIEVPAASSRRKCPRTSVMATWVCVTLRTFGTGAYCCLSLQIFRVPPGSHRSLPLVRTKPCLWSAIALPRMAVAIFIACGTFYVVLVIFYCTPALHIRWEIVSNRTCRGTERRVGNSVSRLRESVGVCLGLSLWFGGSRGERPSSRSLCAYGTARGVALSRIPEGNEPLAPI